MNKFVILFLGVVAVFAAMSGFILFSNQAAAPKNEKITPLKSASTTMTITSPFFQNNAFIPKEFTCDGENINPELQIDGVPASAKSLALIMDDPDIPDFVKQKMGISVFVHWVVFNIPPDTKTIRKGTAPDGAAGLNSAGKTGYIGPCPPPGKPHRYFFKLYALDAKLELSGDATKEMLEREIEKHLLDKAELIGIYERT